MAPLLPNRRPLLALLLVYLLRISSTNAFASYSSTKLWSASSKMSSTNDDTSAAALHPFCQLPGDPSLILTTNVDLGDKKLEIMKGMNTRAYPPRVDLRACLVPDHSLALSHRIVASCLSFVVDPAISKAMEEHTGKPESYIGKCHRKFHTAIKVEEPHGLSLRKPTRARTTTA